MGDIEKSLYPGVKVDVEWNGHLCIHVAECGHAKGDLFVDGRQPWCQPDQVSIKEVVDVINRCPSGALTFTVKDGSIKEDPDPVNTVMVTYNGPYFVRGDLEIEDAPNDMAGIRYRAALCRCGASKNKPFCDNSHESINFKDYGAVGEIGEGISERGGVLNINPLKDGPLLLKGNITIFASSGRKAWAGKELALCRCGASKNKPFCDGSHQEAGFKSD